MARKRARLLVKQPGNDWLQLIPNGHGSYATGRQPAIPATTIVARHNGICRRLARIVVTSGELPR